ncbi:BTB/POZ and TAZ domain-containing protein 2 [Ananas comosus]|uniref:BTB/POZ and TAZ domain-containing protein 2 n=1 Tax=Ananas comosus TaxID=4615 RepID=A0A199VCK1_ANACO|nr:BTB/POZ and TAZ domain-containing protein 2 [Ananas comosus]
MRDFEGSNGLRRWHEAGDESAPSTDARIVTSDGESIPAHSSVLASASPVLDRMLDKSQKNCMLERTIHILGVPCDAVLAFVQLLYSSGTSVSSRDIEEAIEKHGAALLVLSHVYRVEWLKKEAESGTAARLTAERVVDMLKLAKLCDAPKLYLRCMRLAAKDFGAVQQSEAWRFLQLHDPAVEREILQFLEETDQRERRWRRTKEAQEVYHQLNEAMECLHQICSEGCTNVGPNDARRGVPSSCRPCAQVRTCEGLRQLIRHFAACGRKSADGGCPHCRRMLQLFRLHSSLCHRRHSCSVPFCSQFKSRMREEGKEDVTWRLLVKKVIVARVMSGFATRKVPEDNNTLRAGLRSRGGNKRNLN